MSHIGEHRLFTQAEWDTLNQLETLRKSRGVGAAAIDQRDVHVLMAAAHIMSAEELDGDDNEQHGWGPK